MMNQRSSHQFGIVISRGTQMNGGNHNIQLRNGPNRAPQFIGDGSQHAGFGMMGGPQMNSQFENQFGTGMNQGGQPIVNQDDNRFGNGMDQDSTMNSRSRIFIEIISKGGPPANGLQNGSSNFGMNGNHGMNNDNFYPFQNGMNPYLPMINEQTNMQENAPMNAGNANPFLTAAQTGSQINSDDSIIIGMGTPFGFENLSENDTHSENETDSGNGIHSENEPVKIPHYIKKGNNPFDKVPQIKSEDPLKKSTIFKNQNQFKKASENKK